MTVWETPTFEELTMNAEIGAYQPEYGDDERSDEPFVRAAPETSAGTASPVGRG